jgi:hypothetical protein
MVAKAAAMKDTAAARRDTFSVRPGGSVTTRPERSDACATRRLEAPAEGDLGGYVAKIDGFLTFPEVEIPR